MEENNLSEKTSLEMTDQADDSLSAAPPEPPVTAEGAQAGLSPSPQALQEDSQPSPADLDATSEKPQAAPEKPQPAPARPQATPGLAAEPSLETIVEALLFVSPEPVSVAKLAEAAGQPADEVRTALKNLAASFVEANRAVELTEIAGGFQILTRSIFHEVIQAFRKSKSIDRLSASALECLAIVAYKQPIIRAEVEAVRGVQCGPVLRGLLDRRLIRVAGRDKRPGNPILYRTTNRFLEHFGLKSLKGLPSVEELKAPSS